VYASLYVRVRLLRDVKLGVGWPTCHLALSHESCCCWCSSCTHAQSLSVCVCVKCQAMSYSTGDREVPVCQTPAAVAGSCFGVFSIRRISIRRIPIIGLGLGLGKRNRCFGVKTIAYLQARLAGQHGPVIMLQLTGRHGPGRQSLRAGFGPRAGLCRPLV